MHKELWSDGMCFSFWYWKWGGVGERKPCIWHVSLYTNTLFNFPIIMVFRYWVWLQKIFRMKMLQIWLKNLEFWKGCVVCWFSGWHKNHCRAWISSNSPSFRRAMSFVWFEKLGWTTTLLTLMCFLKEGMKKYKKETKHLFSSMSLLRSWSPRMTERAFAGSSSSV